MDAARVEEARTQLIDIGWLIPEESGRAESDRSGAKFRINLSWKRGTPASMAATGPSAAVPGPDRHPPSPTRNSLRGCSETRNPPAAGRLVSDLSARGNRAGAANRLSGMSFRRTSGTPADYFELHAQAVDSGWVGPSESDA